MAINKTRLIQQLKLHEGSRLKPYRDTVGKLTIGVGRNLDDRGLSNDEVDYLLNNDVNVHVAELLKALPWVADLDEVRQRVLVDMAFNMGVPKLLTFKQTLAAVKRGDYWLAAEGMRASLWARQVGDGPGGAFDRAERLCEMMRTGRDYTH